MVIMWSPGSNLITSWLGFIIIYYCIYSYTQRRNARGYFQMRHYMLLNAFTSNSNELINSSNQIYTCPVYVIL